MLFSNSYYTLKEPASADFRVKGSKFLSFAYPVENEEQIKNNLIHVKKLHPSASHHCYAWRLGADKLLFRTNDDGEPSNTAGKQIFSQLQNRDLTNCLVIVVRYFGGTLLGVGGLISAYKEAANLALLNCEIVEQFIYFEYEAIFNYEDLSKVMRLLKETESQIISTTYDNENVIIFKVKKQNTDNLETRFKDLYTVKFNYLRTV